ncbi:hypothetical protein [Pseudarthrobacter sp.]|uniref:hypothetical protein n=1 Tax=Pseudarthrobacter sp. TaxID=1934409 RepID=UPI002FC8BD86
MTGTFRTEPVTIPILNPMPALRQSPKAWTARYWFLIAVAAVDGRTNSAITRS